jgi:hypothetical protein
MERYAALLPPVTTTTRVPGSFASSIGGSSSIISRVPATDSLDRTASTHGVFLGRRSFAAL